MGIVEFTLLMCIGLCGMLNNLMMQKLGKLNGDRNLFQKLFNRFSVVLALAVLLDFIMFRRVYSKNLC